MPDEKLRERWDRICIALLARIGGSVERLSVLDMAALPFDRVLVAYETPGQVRFTHETLKRAEKMLKKRKDNRGEPVEATPLMGRWHKIGATLMWKHFRGGLTLKASAIKEPNPNRVLVIEGHEQDIELRFVSRAEAKVIEAKERFDTGQSIIERIDWGRVLDPRPIGGIQPRFGRARQPRSRW